MKRTTITVIFVFAAAALFAQQKKYIHKGNELYRQQKYKEAEEDYRKSTADSASGSKTGNALGNFNLGDALYREKKYADAGAQFNKLASSANNKTLTARAYHNLGNSLLQSNKLEEAIDAYKKSLLNNPKDDETRYNLAYAEQKLKKQQQQNKQGQQNKNQNNQNQQNKDKQNQNDKNKDNKDQNKQQQQNKQDQQKQQQNQQQPNQISKEDAERMLDALSNEEKQTQDKLKDKRLHGTGKNIIKDW